VSLVHKFARIDAIAVAETSFGDFWRMYPRKVAKLEAQKAWKQMTREYSPEEIIAGLERNLPALQTRDKQYIKHPASWLRAGCWMDEQKGRHVCDFYELLRHYEGELAGKPFILSDWQKYDITIPVYGWQRPGGLRRYRVGYDEITKKQGKSTWAGGTALYAICGDGEEGAECYTAATDREQSNVMFDSAQKMGKASPALRNILEFVPSRYRIVHHASASFSRALSSKSSSAHGLKPHFVLIDETHVFPNAELYDALLYGGRARRQPLVMCFTTAGIYDPTSIGWRLHDQAMRVLYGESYTDWAFHAFVRRVESDPAQASNTKRLLRNIWTAQQHAWMPMDKWAACAGEYTEDDLLDGVCYGGLDCSLLRDITALILWFPPQKDWTRHRFLCRFWVPEAGVTEFDVEYSGMYTTWIKAGMLLATPGETIDQSEIHAELTRLRDKYQIRTIGYDRAFAQNLAQNLEADGFDIGPFGQGVQAVNEPTLKLMELVLNGDLEHPNQPVMNWHISNCQAVLRNGLLRLVKNSSGGRGKAQVRYKIDGAHAAVMALGTSLLEEIFNTGELIR